MTSNKTKLALVAAMALGFSSFAQAQVVVRDAQSGQMRAPTAQEAQALQPAPAPKNRIGMITGRVNPPEIRHANGAIEQELDASTMVYSVVQINPDGSRSMVCVTGEEAALAAVNAPRSSFARKISPMSIAKASQEQKHEVQ